MRVNIAMARRQTGLFMVLFFVLLSFTSRANAAEVTIINERSGLFDAIRILRAVSGATVPGDFGELQDRNGDGRIGIAEALYALQCASGLRDCGQSAVPASVSTILFVSDRDGDFDLFTMHADGTNVTQLTFNSETDSIARWSPDRRKIAFIRNEEAVWIMNSDGADPQFVHDGQSVDFSPDGSKLVFSYYAGNVYDGDDLYTYDFQTGEVTRIVNLIGADYNPDCHSGKIVFTNYFFYGDYFKNLASVNTDGTGLTPLTDYNEWDVAFPDSPRWSPDGSRILYSIYWSGVYPFLALMDADGSNQVALASSSQGPIVSPVWSPDGAFVACSLSGTIYTLDLGVTQVTPLTGSSSGSNFPLDWAEIPVQ